MRRLLAASLAALAACSPPPTQAPTATPESARLAPANLPAFFDCLRTSGQTMVAAHRGGSSPGYAENSIAAFEQSLPAMMEIDIARTSDGALVLMHDDTVDRTTNGSGRVRDLTLAQVQALQLEDETGAVLDAHPPSFREALDWARGKTILELDVKRGVSYEDVLAEVRAADAQGRVIFITYSEAAAARVHGLTPEMMLSVSIDEAGDLHSLAARGVDLTRVLAWTGTDEPNAALNAALARRGVEVIFGTMGGRDSWDARFARDGREQYAAFADAGLQIISTTRPIEAARDLDDNDGDEGVAAMQCVGTQ